MNTLIVVILLIGKSGFNKIISIKFSLICYDYKSKYWNLYLYNTNIVFEMKRKYEIVRKIHYKI